MRAYPFLINKDSTGERLKQIEGKEKVYDETWIQEAIRREPNILPVAEIEPIFYPMIPIGKEVSTDAGSIDNLFISPRGYLILVETKLWRNPEAKREVVAQVIDYASSISKWKYERLNVVAKEYTKKYEKAELNLVEWVEKQYGEIEGGQDYFEETVSKNLRLGRFLALIVSDKIKQSIVEMVKYVNKYPGLAIDLALIELQGYLMRKDRKWPMLIVPRIISRTEIVERSVVQVTVEKGKTPVIDVKQEKVKAEGDERKTVTLTEEAFWELLKKTSPGQYEVVRNLIDNYREEAGIEIVPKSSSIAITLRLHETGQLLSILFVSKSGRLWVWPRTVARQLSAAGIDKTIGKVYDKSMRDILKMPSSRAELGRMVADINIEKLKIAVDKLISKVKLYESSK